MKANELRIGNYVKRSMPNHDLEMDRYTWQITAGGLYAYSQHIYRPIPLTDEWLIKLGFKDGKIHLFDDYILEASMNAFSGTLSLDSKWFISIIRIASNDKVTMVREHVHQLQNLYFALTGKELKKL